MTSSRSKHYYYYDALCPQIGNASSASRCPHTSSRGLRLELTGRNAVLRSEKDLYVCRLNRPRGFAKPLGNVAGRFGVVGWDGGLLWSGLGLVWSEMLDYYSLLRARSIYILLKLLLFTVISFAILCNLVSLVIFFPSVWSVGSFFLFLSKVVRILYSGDLFMSWMCNIYSGEKLDLVARGS
jgi:hypothetical protein